MEPHALELWASTGLFVMGRATYNEFAEPCPTG